MRLFDMGNEICSTGLIGSGWKYSLSGDCCGTEIFGSYTIATKTMEPFPVVHEFHHNGVVIKKGDTTSVVTGDPIMGGMSCFSGIHQPFSLWDRVTFKGTETIEKVERMIEKLEKNSVTYERQYELHVQTIKIENIENSQQEEGSEQAQVQSSGVVIKQLDIDSLDNGDVILDEKCEPCLLPYKSYSLWHNVTFKGTERVEKLERLIEKLKENGFSYDVKFILTINSENHRILARPAPYVNGMDLYILEKKHLEIGEWVHDW